MATAVRALDLKKNYILPKLQRQNVASGHNAIAIISDSHDNVPNLEKALEYINDQNIKTLIHCGDICSPTVLKRIIEPNFKGQIYLVHGNVSDRNRLEEYVKKYDNVQLCGDSGSIEMSGRKITFCHFPDEAKKLARSRKYDIVFYGHTHKPWLSYEKLNGRRVKLVNPGTLAGMFYKATFAIYYPETDKLELKILEKI